MAEAAVGLLHGERVVVGADDADPGLGSLRSAVGAEEVVFRDFRELTALLVKASKTPLGELLGYFSSEQ